MNQGFGATTFDGGLPDWVIAGQAMTFEQFMDTLYPIDCPEKTMLILKLKGE